MKSRFSSATGTPARNYQKQDMRARPEPDVTAPEVFAGATVDSRRKAAHEDVSEEDKSKSMVAAVCGRRALDGCCRDRSDWPVARTPPGHQRRGPRVGPGSTFSGVKGLGNADA
jgi:hypothetical protein